MEFKNSYSDSVRAESYSKLGFPNTYFLAFRDLAAIIFKYVKGTKALDFGCGTGRSTRYLNNLGFETTGVDISEEMIRLAKDRDRKGQYQLIKEDRFDGLAKQSFDLILSAFTFDNIPDFNKRIHLLIRLRSLMKHDGIVILLDSTPEIYFHEWASFSTKDFPENRKAKGGDPVKIIMKDVEDKRAVEDIIWFEEDYKFSFDMAGFELLETAKPLGRDNEPFVWINETSIAPWVIYVLGNNHEL
ncbi:MAG: class I SAM-dependent methyltransferase [Bacteroidales bacterium]|nr:MAG: class I SAM-dependent methyltransferase [Bacteroidales bacterium]